MRAFRLRGSRAFSKDSRCNLLYAYSSVAESCCIFSIALRTPALTGFSRTSKLSQKLLANASCGTRCTPHTGRTLRGRSCARGVHQPLGHLLDVREQPGRLLVEVEGMLMDDDARVTYL